MGKADHPMNDEPVAGGSTFEALRRIRRRRRWRMFLKLAALAVVLLAVAAFAAQTSFALKRLWLPVVSRQLGTRVAAENGTISYRGNLYLNRFVIVGTDGEPALSADEIWFEMAPLSILTGRPHIRRAEAVNPIIRVLIDGAGRTNWDLPGLAAKPEPKPRKQETPAIPSIAIDRLVLEQVNLDLQQSDQLRVKMTAPSLEIRNLAPGARGDFAFSIEGSAERPNEKIAHRGRITADGKLNLSADGRQIDWQSKFKASLTGTAPAFEGEQKVDVSAASGGSYNTAGLLTHRLAMDASSPSGASGSIKLDDSWDMSKDIRNAKLTIDNVGREALNPALALVAPLQMQRGVVNGTGVVETHGEVIGFGGDIQAEGLTFELADQKQPTDAMSLRLRHAGEFNAKTDLFTLRQAEATLTQADRRLVQAALDKPLTFAIGQNGNRSTTETEAVFRVKIDNLTARNLRPWLMLARVDAGNQPTAGALNGEFTVGVTSLGARLKAQGELRANELRHPALGPNPLDLRNQFEIAFTDFNDLDFRRITLDLTSGPSPIAKAALSGRVRVGQQAGEFMLDLASPQALTAASTLGLMAKPGEGIRDGRLNLQQQIQFDMTQGKSFSTGELDIAGMEVVGKSGSVPLGVKGDNRFAFDSKRGRFDVENMRLNLSHPGQAQPGLVEVTGRWDQPPAAKAGSGQFKITASRLNLEPWLRVTGAVSGPNVPAIPFETDEQITIDPAGKIRIQGDVSFGVDPGPTTATTARRLTVQIKHTMIQAGARLQEAQMELTSQAGTTRLDHVLLSASGELGPEPNILCSARVESLDLNPYLAWMDRLSAPETGAPAAEAAAKKPNPMKGVFDARLDVAELLWKEGRLKNAKGDYRYENGAMTIDVAEGLLNDGHIKAHAEIDLTRIEPRYAWNVNIENADASRVIGLFDPERAKRVSGKLTIDSQCTGQGAGETFKNTFQGKNDFKLTNGELHGVWLLDILAKQTLVPSFSNMKFFDFSGGIDVANRIARLKEVKITGPEHRIDVEGQFDLDGQYDVALIPAVATGVAEKIRTNKWLPTLVQSVPGFMQFPFKVIVKGTAKSHTIVPVPRLPVNVGNVGEAVGGAVGTIGGAVGKAVEKVPGSGVVTRPIEELRKLNPLGADRQATGTQEKEGMIEKIPGKQVIQRPVEKLIRLNPLRKDRRTSPAR